MQNMQVGSPNLHGFSECSRSYEDPMSSLTIFW